MIVLLRNNRYIQADNKSHFDSIIDLCQTRYKLNCSLVLLIYDLQYQDEWKHEVHNAIIIFTYSLAEIKTYFVEASGMTVHNL